MKIYRHENKILAFHHKDADWKKGLDFLTSDDLFIQAGTWWYNQGKILDSHIHNTFERITNITQEVVYVKRGSMKAFLFNERKEFVCDFILKKGVEIVLKVGKRKFLRIK